MSKVLRIKRFMSFRVLVGFMVLVVSSAALSMRDDFSQSPGILNQSDGRRLVPMDLQTVDVRFEMNAETREIEAVAVVDFVTKDNGRPYFDIKSSVSSLTIDGASESPALIESVNDSSHSTAFTVINKNLAAGHHKMTMTYVVSQSRYCGFDEDSNLDCFFFMYDLTERTFFEQYAPSNFEFDRYKMTVTIDVTGTSREHLVLSNGVLESSGNTFRISFPEYFNTSCFFLHVMPRGQYQVTRGFVSSNNYELVVYGQSAQAIQNVYRIAQQSLEEMTAVFGPSRYRRFLILVDESFPGGMEFAGGAITSSAAARHEMCHSWFARGTMPANGNAGWIDEGIATWRDENYPSYPARPATYGGKLGGSSPFQRMTPQNAYTDGATFFGRLHYELSSTGGLFPLLRAFHLEYFGKTISSERFLEFINSTTGHDFRFLFNEFVF